jgi:hypothetical protein
MDSEDDMGYEEESDGELDEESSENDDFVEMRLS